MVSFSSDSRRASSSSEVEGGIVVVGRVFVGWRTIDSQSIGVLLNRPRLCSQVVWLSDIKCQSLAAHFKRVMSRSRCQATRLVWTPVKITFSVRVSYGDIQHGKSCEM